MLTVEGFINMRVGFIYWNAFESLFDYKHILLDWRNMFSIRIFEPYTKERKKASYFRMSIWMVQKGPWEIQWDLPI